MNSPMTTPELIQWLRENSSGVYRPSCDAADLIERLTARNAELTAALFNARNFITNLLNVTGGEAVDILTNGAGEQEETDASVALGADAFDLGENVIVEPANSSEYQGLVVGKREDRDGTPLFTVEDQEGNCRDHSADEIHPAY